MNNTKEYKRLPKEFFQDIPVKNSDTLLTEPPFYWTQDEIDGKVDVIITNDGDVEENSTIIKVKKEYREKLS